MIWTHTSRGRALDLLDPKIDDVDLEEIARSLANQCRFAGCVRQFYCPTPDQRILTAELEWVPAGDLRVGDELVGFDEEPTELGQAGKRKRRFRPSRVLTQVPVRRRVVRLVFDDGSDVCASEEHPWLVAAKISGNQKWETAGAIRDAVRRGKPRRMNRFVEPWSAATSWEDGWLAGIFDGEGHLARRADCGGMQVGVAQKPGEVLNSIVAGLVRNGFGFGEHVIPQSKVHNLQIRGGWRTSMRLLGQIRPRRLLGKFIERFHAGEIDKQMNGTGTAATVVAVYDEGERECAGIETSTRTYLCEGFGAHNSVAEHSVLIARWLRAQGHNDGIVIGGLLHDAAEAYTGDITQPMQEALFLADEWGRVRRRYKNIQARLDAIIARKAGITPGVLHCDAVKEADLRILLDERRALLTEPPPLPWAIETELGMTPLGVEIEGWLPDQAAREFLAELDRCLRAHGGRP